MVKFIALCCPGLEEFVAHSLGLEKYSVFPGIVVFEHDDISKLKEITIVDDILILKKKYSGISRYRASLRNIRHQTAKAYFGEGNFNIKVSYKGRRDYTAKEVEDIVKRMLKEGNEEKYIHVILIPEISFIGESINTPIHIAGRLKYTIPGSLRNSIACSMLRLARIKKRDIILDPMCGSGTIAVEAALLGAKVIAGDIDKEAIEKAKKNAKEKDANVIYNEWDARNTELKEQSIDAVISNLPFGKQVKINEKEIFFSEFLDEMKRLLKSKGRMVLLTADRKLIKKLSEEKGLIVKESFKIVNAGLESEIIVIYR